MAAVNPLGNETDVTYNAADQPLTASLPSTGQTGMGRTMLVFTYQYVGGPLAGTALYDESALAVRQAAFAYGTEGEPWGRSGAGRMPRAPTTRPTAPSRCWTAAGIPSACQYNTAGYVSQVTRAGDALQFPSYDPTGRLLQRIDGNGLEADFT